MRRTLWRVNEESQREEMNAAIRAQRERGAVPRSMLPPEHDAPPSPPPRDEAPPPAPPPEEERPPAPPEEPEAATPPAEPEDEKAPPEPESPPRRSWLSRLFRR